MARRGAREHSLVRGSLLGFVPLLLLTVGLSLVLLGCRGQAAQSGDVSISLEVSPQPAAVGPAEVVVQLKAANGTPVRNAKVKVEGNMSHAGMVPVLVDAEEREPGEYATKGYRFTMGGDWFITVTATLADGQKVEKVFDLKGVSGGKMHQGKNGGGGR